MLIKERLLASEIPLLSSSAKADDPVNTDVRDSSDNIAITGCPAFAGHDDGGYVRSDDRSILP